MHIGQVKHDNWMAKAYLLGGNSMLIAVLLYVNVVKDNAFKVLNTLKIPLIYLFCNFILSNKMNCFNKRKVCWHIKVSLLVSPEVRIITE